MENILDINVQLLSLHIVSYPMTDDYYILLVYL